MAEVRALGDKIAEDDKELKDIEARLKEILMTIPEYAGSRYTCWQQ